MSGGAWDYAYYKLEDLSRMVHDREIADLLKDLSELLHDEEWYESGDYNSTDYYESLAKFKQKWFGDSREKRLKQYIDDSIEELKGDLYMMISNG